MLRRVVRVGVPLLLVGLVIAAGWLVFSGSRAVAAVNDLQAGIDQTRDAVAAGDIQAATEAADAVRDAARRADDALDDPLWAVVSAIPYLGDTAEAARVTADAVAIAATGLDGLVELTEVLDPATLYADGRVAVERIEAAQQPVAQASEALTEAVSAIEAAPTVEAGAWVLGGVDSRRAAAAVELADLADALSTAESAVDVLPGLLGADGPRTWFVGLQTPAEARGTGGLVGTYVVLRADDGRLSLVGVGSNTDFDLLSALPDFGDQYRYRYGNDPLLFLNSNISPHFPYAAQLWRQFYEESVGGSVDVVMGTDVVALGALVEATGPITLPTGQVLQAEDAVDFGLSGVYAQFEDPEQRKEFQEEVAAGIFGTVTAGGVSGEAMVEALSSIIRDDRLLLWSPDEDEQQSLLDLPTSGSVAAAPGPYGLVAVSNGSGSKLDAYLERSIRYEAGRCSTADRVESRMEVTLTSAIPEGVTLPDYVVGSAEVTADGPVSRTQVQVHLAPDAAFDEVLVDGQPAAPYAFREQGRIAVLFDLDLVPRRPTTITLRFNEPATDLPVEVPVQPLARPATVEVIDRPCEPDSPTATDAP